LVWELDGIQLKKWLTLECRVHDIACSPNGKTIITAAYENVIVWDLQSGKQQQKMPGHEFDVACVAYSPNGNLIISGGEDTKIMVYDAHTRELTAKVSVDEERSDEL